MSVGRLFVVRTQGSWDRVVSMGFGRLQRVVMFPFRPSSLCGSLSSQRSNLVPFQCSKRHFTEKRRYILRGTATRDPRQVTESRFTRTEHYELVPGLAVCPKSGYGPLKSRGMAQLLQKQALFGILRLSGRVFVPDPQKSGYSENAVKNRRFCHTPAFGGTIPRLWS